MRRFSPQPLHLMYLPSRPLSLPISGTNGWTNKQKCKLNQRGPGQLTSAAGRLSAFCLQLPPALTSPLRGSVEKHQYLDDCIFFPNAHNILCPGNIYGLSSEITNWICHPARRENVWRMVAHLSCQGDGSLPKLPAPRLRAQRRGAGGMDVPAVTWALSHICHLVRAVCI